ncbi:MAG TPA: TatD family hydrolase [Spirochaetota bacterium]|nr:TatD family hydrolase [Spirochaetota bacterium]HPJ33484.1 TatD family hydrolase [Spirochaetota bacterium]
MLLDSHCHFDIILEDKKITEEDLIRSLKYNNIEYGVQVSIDAKGLEWSRDFVKRNYKNGLYYTLGIHPSSNADEASLEKLASFTGKEMEGKFNSLLLGIGECGLDFYRMKQSEDIQRRSFEYQIDLAKKHKLPLIIHLRDAMEEGIDLLKKKRAGHGIMHCFAGDSAAAKRVLDMGFMISFAGNVTYKNAVELHDAAAYVPLDRILIETDSPFLTPVPLRGKPNVPEYIKHTFKFIADLKKVPQSKLEDSVSENFRKLIRK